MLVIVFFDYSHPSGCEVITVVLVCISLMVNDREHLFMCLWAMCISSLEKSIQILCSFKKLGYLFMIEF